MTSQASQARRLSQNHSAAGRFGAAIEEAWAAYRLDPDDLNSKMWLAGLLHRHPETIDADKASDVLRLIEDQEIDPDTITMAGWTLVLRDPAWHAATESGAIETLAARLEADELVQALLRETPVYSRDAERKLVKVRRWLLMTAAWPRYPRLVDALAAQATLNGGAWPFEEDERALHDEAVGLPILAAYLPVQDPDHTPRLDVSHPLMRAVAEDYERWPYPVWTRVMVQPRTLPEFIRALDPDGPESIPADGSILVAGCGTGREAVTVALEYPQARVTAVDISGASLRYAHRRCAELGVGNIRFLQLDLHNVGELNERFDYVKSCGVLHHIPDPERGLSAIAAVLEPGGVMEIEVYSLVGRAEIEAERTMIRGFLTPGPITDDTLRQVRQVLRDQPNSSLARYRDFSTLAGTYDAIFHRQVDAFDVPRIARALERLRLRLIAFALPSKARARYDKAFPHDPLHRDVEALAKFEKIDAADFRARMHQFWRRSAASA
jgi:SAM-dependent methyltransferase